jgi:Htaa protein
MQAITSSRGRFALAVVAMLAALVALPSMASAARATRGTDVHTQRESWVNYLNAFSGTIRATGSASYSAGGSGGADDRITYAFDSANTTYDLTGTRTGSGVIAFSGGVDFDLAAHYIDLSFSDPRITLGSTTDSSAEINMLVSYDPFETSGSQLRNPTTPTRMDVFTVDLSSVFTGGANNHTWTDAVPRLTADGARAFNGGTNGAYSTGDLFGRVTFSAGN